MTQLELGQEIPESLYQAIVEIYVYFLHFEPELDQAKSNPQGGHSNDKKADIPAAGQ